MKTNSLCFRLTVMTGAILLLCSIALTLTASHNAGVQLTAVAGAALPGAGEIDYTFVPSPIVDMGGHAVATGLATVTEARRSFDLAGLAALLVISVLGTGAVYAATKHALKPIVELNEQIAAITEHNLDERVSESGRADEVGMLCRSFNVMLERLSASFAARKRFSANVAHELKTPLATMQAGVQVMRLEQSPTREEYARMLDTVERNTSRLRAIIEDLMRLCDEQERFEQEDIALEELFGAILSELAPALEERHIQTKLDCGAYPVVMGNQGLLYRAFFNLIENAVKYNRDGGSVEISSRVENNIGVIRVKDTGSGIPEEALPLIFEPFYRVSKSRSRKTGGAGLGLAVAKTIIERHGWSITAESAVGLGTEFTVHLFQS